MKLTSEYLAAQAQRHNITVSALIGPSRYRIYVRARSAVAKDLRSRGWSYPRIGKLLNRDHTTIINLVRMS